MISILHHTPFQRHEGDGLAGPDVFSNPRQWPMALRVAGMKHVSDNLVHSVLSGTVMYKESWPSLKKVEALLGRVTWREKFVQSCIPDDPQCEEDRNSLKHWSYHLKSSRWEVVVEFCNQAFCPN